VTAPDLCRLASAAFPNLTFTPMDGVRCVYARASTLYVTHYRDFDRFACVVFGERDNYQGVGNTIEAAHADALACRAEYEPAPTMSAPAQLPLF
jgi:hypothetical protein